MIIDSKALTGEAFMRDPSGLVDALRAQGDIVAMRLPIIGAVWVAVSHEAGGRVLKEIDCFTIRKDGKVAGMQWWMPGTIRALANNMLTFDEPDHKRLRSVVDDAFARRSILEMEPAIRAIADELADRLFANNSSPTEPVDLIAAYCRQLPLAVICELLGLPQSDRPRFSAWADGLTRTTGVWSFLRTIPGLRQMRLYLERRITTTRQGDGEPGLIADLVEAQTAGAPISDDELVAMAFLLLVAGHETTTHLLSGSMLRLLSFRDEKAWLFADASRMALAVEEFLRFVAPVQFTKPRFVARDMEVCGQQLKRGDKIMVMLTAANRDPSTSSPCPHAFDMTRHPNRHVSFGAGIHFCLGHQLARLETKIGIEALFARWPELKLAVEPDAVRWRSRLGLRAVDVLLVSRG